MSVTFRNVDVDPSAAVERWPAEAVETAMHRGTLTDWRRFAAAIRISPWSELARTVEQVAGWGDDPGVDALMLAVIERARSDVTAAGRARYAAHVRELRRSSGLSLRAFAALAGTSAARLSDYEHARTAPTTDVLTRLEHAAAVAGNRSTPS
ncbi:MAG TPA: helix-turn-helix transcriptional regulator [Ilumatobacter sp.]|nr:helix-turn-helix transcriptional regulator [Ilumatobacter sp.]